LDLTLIGTELSGDGTAFAGFAQSNELAITLFGAGAGPGGTDLNLFIQKQWAGLSGAGVSDSKNHAAQWAGDDGTRTLVWDLTKFTANDPNTGTTKSVAQFLAAYPGITDGKIAFVAQAGGGNRADGELLLRQRPSHGRARARLARRARPERSDAVRASPSQCMRLFSNFAPARRLTGGAPESDQKREAESRQAAATFENSRRQL